MSALSIALTSGVRPYCLAREWSVTSVVLICAHLYPMVSRLGKPVKPRLINRLSYDKTAPAVASKTAFSALENSF